MRSGPSDSGAMSNQPKAENWVTGNGPQLARWSITTWTSPRPGLNDAGRISFAVPRDAACIKEIAISRYEADCDSAPVHFCGHCCVNDIRRRKLDVTGKAFWRSRAIAQQISWPARACAPAGGQEISGSSRACNVCSADSNADTRGGKSRASSPFGTPRSTAPALPSCISWFATRPK